MAIRMRNNTDPEAKCCNCGERQADVLNMFDLGVGNLVLPVCDVCNNQILVKALRAECMKNGRTKSQRDMAIIRKRQQAAYAERQAQRAGTNLETKEPSKRGKVNGK